MIMTDARITWSLVALLIFVSIYPVRGLTQDLDNAAKVNTSGYKTAPDDLPRVSVTLATAEVGDGYIFLSPYERRLGATPYAQYAMIVDNTGELIYYRPARAGHDFKKLTNGLLAYHDTFSQRLLDSSYNEVDLISAVGGFRADFHDFQLLPNGHYMLLIYEPRQIDMSEIVEGGDPDATVTGCRLQELDTDKNVAFEWTSFDHIPITNTAVGLFAPAIDYVHCNAVDQDTDGHLLLSSRDLNEVTKIDHESGEVLWRLGGKENQFTFVNEVGAEFVEFSRQHDVRRVANGNITLFDNRSGPYSRAVEYQLDEENKVASLIWEHRNDPDIYAQIMANAQRLPNGNTLIGWGSGHPAVTEVKRDGTKVFELELPIELNNYRAYRFPWSGLPASEPALIVDSNAPTNTSAITLTYSWNGATDVAAYRIYGDRSAYPKTLIAVEPKSGFETTTVITQQVQVAAVGGPMKYRVVPLDVHGRPMLPDEVVDLSQSSAAVLPPVVQAGEGPTHTVTYSLTLRNTGPISATIAALTDRVPAAIPPLSLNIAHGPGCDGGICTFSPDINAVTWNGSLPVSATVQLSYTLLVDVPVTLTGNVHLVSQVDVVYQDEEGSQGESSWPRAVLIVGSTPIPTATRTKTPTLEPTETLLPTSIQKPTLIPTQTPVPTLTQTLSPTATPLPTPTVDRSLYFPSVFHR